MNELYWVILIIINFVLILASYRILGKIGLFVWMPISVIIANVQVLKVVELFGFTATLGNIVYAASFLVTDVLSEIYGKKEARKAVVAGFIALIVSMILMQAALIFNPAPDDTIQPALESIFGILPRLAASSLAAFLVSQFVDVRLYHFIREKLPEQRFMWVRNNGSTMVSQLLDSVIFTFAAFLGVFSLPVVLEIMVTTYVLKALVAASDTPFLYLAVRMYNKGKISDQ